MNVVNIALPPINNNAHGNNSDKRKANDYNIRNINPQIKKKTRNFNPYNPGSPQKDVGKFNTLTAYNDYSNKNYSNPTQTLQSLPEKIATLEKIKSTESINSLPKILKEEEFKRKKQDIKEFKVDILEKDTNSSHIDEKNIIFNYLESSKKLTEENINLKEENKLLQSKINELHDEISSFHQKKLQIQSIDSLNIVNQHNNIATFQKNNAMLSNELKQMKLSHDDMKAKFIKEKSQLEKELELLMYKNNELQKVVDSNIDPNYEILKVEYKEVRRAYDLLAVNSEEQKKKILEIETGVTEDVKLHIRELEETITKLGNEKDELRTKLMIALMS